MDRYNCFFFYVVRAVTLTLVDLQNALKDGKEDVTYARVMFIGPSGVGKSSLLRGLMGMELEAANSTVLADTYHLKHGWAKAGFFHKYWCKVEEEDEIRELAMLIHKVQVKKEQFQDTQSPPPESVEAIKAASVNENERTKSREQHKQSDDFLKEMKGILGDKQIEFVKKAYDLAESPDFQASNTTPEVLLHVWDCGGQPVYLDALQPFLSSHTMFFLLYNAAAPDGLDSLVKSVWYEKGVETKHGNLEVTVLDQLQQWMAAIHASLFLKESALSPSKLADPKIMLVGTHGDLPGINHQEVTGRIEAQCKGKAFNQLIIDNIILDNTKAGKVSEDKEFNKIREKIYKLSKKNLTVETPVAWVLFRKLLSEVESYPTASLEEVFAIAKLCEIEEKTVPSVLRFYRELGVFLYYPEVQALRQIVFVDPQWLVKQIGKILTLRKGHGYDREAARILSEYGILVEPLYNQAWMGFRVKPQAFVSLLEHYLLLAPSRTPPTTCIHAFEGNSYFIPAMLPLCKESNAKPSPPALQLTDPLCLTFSTHYLPPGFFVRLVAVLEKHRNCDIIFDRNLFRNSVCFSYLEKTIVNLTAKSTHVEITVTREVTRQHESKLFVDICQGLLALVYDSSLKVLNLFSGITITPALCCNCQESTCCFINLFVHCQTALKSDEPLQCVRGNNCCATPNQQFWLTIPDVKEVRFNCYILIYRYH